MSKLPEIVAKNLTRKMRENKLSQTKLAEVTGIAQPTISLYAKGQRDDLKLATLGALAEGIGCHPWQLLLPEDLSEMSEAESSNPSGSAFMTNPKQPVDEGSFATNNGTPGTVAGGLFSEQSHQMASAIASELLTVLRSELTPTLTEDETKLLKAYRAASEFSRALATFELTGAPDDRAHVLAVGRKLAEAKNSARETEDYIRILDKLSAR